MNLNLIKVLDKAGDEMLLSVNDFVCAHQRNERGQSTDVNLGEEGRGAACADDLDSIISRIKAKLITLTLKKGTKNHDIGDGRIILDPTKIKRLALGDDGKTVHILFQNDLYVVEESTEKILELIAQAGVGVNII